MLVARVTTNRSDMEYFCRNRQDIMDMLDMLYLVLGDVINLQMIEVEDVELVGLPEASAEDIAEWEGYQETLLITERVGG